MNDTAAPSWLDANQKALAAEFARLRERLQAMLPGEGSRPPAAVAAVAEAPHDQPPAFERIAQLFGLSPFERDVLLLAAGVEMDSTLAGMVAAVQTARHGAPSFALAMGLLFLAGVSVRLFAGLTVTMALTFFALIWASPWRRERIFAYLDPFDEKNALGKGYLLSHSLIAFGRGEWFGVGLGGSVEKWHYLPEAHTDFLLAVVGEELGFVGVTLFAPFLAKGIDSTIDDYAEAIEYTMNIVGEDAIGIGTDFTQGHGQDFFEMLTHDKGYARRLTSFGKIINPLGIRTVGEFPNLTETLLKRGHSERVVRKIMGENWVNVLKDVWGE